VNHIESVLSPDINLYDDIFGVDPSFSRGVLMDLHSFGEDFFWPPNYEVGISSPNEEGFKAMASKMSFLTEGRYSTHNEIYATSGDITDYAYENLGMMTFTMELGTTFHEDCSYFEEYVVEDAINSLLYAAKVSNSPFHLSKGPEVLSFTLSDETPNPNDIIEVVIEISDVRVFDYLDTTGQKISSLNFYFDSHPNDINGTSPIEINSQSRFAESKYNFEYFEETVKFELSFKDISPGKYTLYVQAYDESGPGPVYARFVEVNDG